MSVTHPEVSLAPVRRAFAVQHPHLAPFLVAMAIFVVTVALSLAFTGLP
jgi:hypothetical protein